jgi:hypothetical protein
MENKIMEVLQVSSIDYLGHDYSMERQEYIEELRKKSEIQIKDKNIPEKVENEVTHHTVNHTNPEYQAILTQNSVNIPTANILELTNKIK